MKKIIIAVLLVVIFPCLFLSCSPGGEKINLYFANASKTELVSQPYVLENETASPQEKAEEALRALLTAPASPEHTRIIPTDTQVLDLFIQDSVLTVNFSSAFESTGEYVTDAILARCSVVKTLTEINGIDKVQILVAGASIISASTGEPIPALGAGDIVMSPGGDTMDKVVLTLYFYHPQKNVLQEEKRVITVKENTAMAKNIVQELLKGPENKELVSLLSSETEIISADTKEGVCFVNFDRVFQDKTIADANSAQFAIYSIVNSLTEISSVNRVQFLINGEKIESIQNVTINEPFSRNDSLIEGYISDNNETGLEVRKDEEL